jgi:hypothetical protein
MNERDFERREKARLDAMYDAQFADEPTSDVEYADEPLVNGWPLYSGLPQPMKPTQEQVLQWAQEVWGDNSGKPWHESALVHLKAFAAIAYEADCKDKALQRLNKAAEDNGEEL